jgi:hypothetical protein
MKVIGTHSDNGVAWNMQELGVECEDDLLPLLSRRKRRAWAFDMRPMRGEGKRENVLRVLYICGLL